MKLLSSLPLLGWVLLPGCWTLTGPDTVHGYVGGSLSVSCQYNKDYENNTKFWCKESWVSGLCTINLGFAVGKDRFFIEDNMEKHYFNVTMVKLRLEDSDVYQCGIRRSTFTLDIRHSVQVTVFPGPTSDPEEKLATTKQPDLDPSIGPTGIDTSIPNTTPAAPLRPELQILVCSIVPLFILLLLAIVVLVVLSRKKKTGSCLRRKKEVNPTNTDSEKRDEVPYATLVLSDLQPQQQVTYDNVNLSSHTLPRPLSQEVIYTEVAKKPGH